MRGTAKAALLWMFLQAAAPAAGEEYLNWGEKRCREVGKRFESKGRVQGSRGLTHTERAHNYRIRATWLTPELIRAAARLEQIQNRLTDQQTRDLVAEAEAVGETVMMIAIDPQEGSGVVPRDWSAFLGPRDSVQGGVPGDDRPELRRFRVLAGVRERDYAYQYFWVVFPLVDASGNPLFTDSSREAELSIRIREKEGRVTFQVPDSIRKRAAAAGS